MKEYINGGSTPKEQYFGYRLCSARNVIECAFGHLKTRFGALRRTMDINMDDLPYVIYACFILHNFCEMNRETMFEEVIMSAIDYNRDFQPQQQNATRGQGANDAEGKIRCILTNYFDPQLYSDICLIINCIRLYLSCALLLVVTCFGRSYL